MSLLWMEYDTDFQNLADAVFECECHGNPDYFLHLTPKVKKIILRDTRYNIDFSTPHARELLDRANARLTSH